MKRKLIVKLTIAGCVAAVLGFSVIYGLRVTKRFQLRTQCRSQLCNVDLALQTYDYPAYSNYPPTLAAFRPGSMMALGLVCPEATPFPRSKYRGGGLTDEDLGHTLAEMDKWTDYIYVSGLTPSSGTGIPMVICPPINHGGKGGNVLFTEHSVQWMPPPEIDRLIDGAYAYAKSNGLRVVVSEALTRRSGGRYRSSP